MYLELELELELERFLYSLVFYICSLLSNFRQKTEVGREDEFEGRKAEEVCLLQVETERLAI